MLEGAGALVASYLSPQWVTGSLLSGALGWIAARMSVRSAEKISEQRRDDAATAERRAVKAAEADVTTARLRILLDGYERRIASLTHEVNELRARVEICEARWEAADANAKPATRPAAR